MTHGQQAMMTQQAMMQQGMAVQQVRNTTYFRQTDEMD